MLLDHGRRDVKAVAGNLDVDALVLTDFVIMVVFVVASNVATHSLDRLVVGGTGFVLAGE